MSAWRQSLDQLLQGRHALRESRSEARRRRRQRQKRQDSFRPELEALEDRVVLDGIATQTAAYLLSGPNTNISVDQQITIQGEVLTTGEEGSTPYPVGNLIFTAAPSGSNNYQTLGTAVLAPPPGAGIQSYSYANLTGAFSAAGTYQIEVQYPGDASTDPPWAASSAVPFDVNVSGTAIPTVVPSDCGCDSAGSLLGSAPNTGLGGSGAGGSAAGNNGRGTAGASGIGVKTLQSRGGTILNPDGGSGMEASGYSPSSSGGGASFFSANPVRYFDGVVQINSTDLSSDGFGMPWGQTRSWTNNTLYASASDNGNGWVDTQEPELISSDNGTILTLVESGTEARIFMQNSPGSNSYTQEFMDQAQLTYDSTNHTYTLADTTGDILTFADFVTGPAGQHGQLLSIADPYGNVTTVSRSISTGQVTEILQTAGSGDQALNQEFLYSYVPSINPNTGNPDPNAGLLQSVTLQQQRGTGAWTTIRSVVYTYYDGSYTGSELYGNLHDLMMAVVEDPSGYTISTDYYRYYTPTDAGTIGYVGGLKYDFTGDSYLRLVNSLHGNSPTTASDSAVGPYADNYFQYGSQQRATEEIAQQAGAGTAGSTSGGLGTFTYSYTASGSYFATANAWAERTTVTNPDGSEDIVYTNGFGEPILTIAQSTTGQQSLNYFQYNDAGQLILTAAPSGVSGYNDSWPDLVFDSNGNNVDLNTSSGVFTWDNYATTTTATSSSPGDAAGYLQSVQISQGYTGTPITQESWKYIAHTDENGNTIYLVASDTVYPNTDPTKGAEETDYSYAWSLDSNLQETNQVQSIKVTYPTIASGPIDQGGQNGPGTADTETTIFDNYGRPTWTQDGDGFITYTAYDLMTGAVTESITDVDTSNPSTPSTLPAGWKTPTGGGLNLVTTYQVDGLGRTTEETDPNGDITYTLYLDSSHEVRAYPGFQPSTGLATGPTQVYRDDLSGSYSEVLTMTTTPHLTGGVPDGTEPLGNEGTLSRQYVNDAGQVIEDDNFFNLSGVEYSITYAHIGVAGTNYYVTQFGYDAQGRQNYVLSPTGTITRTVYDFLGRVVAVWVGTNDSDATDSDPTGGGAPGNNMMQVSGYVYDNGGVGDGNLTASIQYPGGSTTAQQAAYPPRETDYYYDWRDRPVLERDGVHDGSDINTNYITYDNLDEVTEQQTYAGDSATVASTDGVPNPPAADLLRSQTVTAYDAQGRPYQQQVYSVLPTAQDGQPAGTISSTALTTNYYYDRRGDLIATSAPGGLWTKQSFDGAGRLTVTYSTDGAGGTTWTDAGSVAHDNVLEQRENVYDGDGNVIETLDSQRFDNATAQGSLAPNGSVAARTYYQAEYYDAANRLIADVNVGDNFAMTWTRPSTVPRGSNTVLVTSYQYNAAGWVFQETDPLGNKTETSYDNLGRVTQTIAAYTDGIPTTSNNQTTQYTYDGDNHVLTVTAVQPGNVNNQVTQYVYGATTAAGSAINSNDLLVGIEYPDPTTGAASSANEEMYAVDALGQPVSYLDRNGTKHGYSYDLVGRQTADTVTQFGTGVDQTIHELATAYNDQGLPYLYTSYGANDTIVNQVEDVYNGLGQLTGEYQSHSGAINTSTTPEVQYVYNDMANGTNDSRLTEMIYPYGRNVDYNYNSGVDNAISRLSSLSDGSDTLDPGQVLEAYTYLGLDTVVQRTRPQNDTALTYISQTGGGGDGGDRYYGLDRFGRVVAQLWLNTSSGGQIDGFTYGYDNDSNVLFAANIVDVSEDRCGSLPGRWVNSHDLREGDVVFLRSRGPVTVRRLTQRHERTPVCNLTVEALHTFAVGEMQVLVHNTSGTSGQPPLSPLHPDSSLSPAKMAKYEKLSTQDLIDSLKPGQQGALKVRPDGTMIDGHHRIKILRNRGVNVDALPREVVPKDPLP